jgi:transcription elongation factor Elf1
MEEQIVSVKVSEFCPECDTAFEKQVDVVVDGDYAIVQMICSVCGEQFKLEAYLELTAYTVQLSRNPPF